MYLQFFYNGKQFGTIFFIDNVNVLTIKNLKNGKPK